MSNPRRWISLNDSRKPRETEAQYSWRRGILRAIDALEIPKRRYVPPVPKTTLIQRIVEMKFLSERIEKTHARTFSAARKSHR